MAATDSITLALDKWMMNVITGKTQTSQKNKDSIYTGLSPYLKVPQSETTLAAPGSAPSPAPSSAPSPIQIAPVVDMISTIMTPKAATAVSPTGGDGANKQAYGGDIATMRPVANAGDTGGTMLTGPAGVDPDALLLAKKTLLGA